MIALNFNTILIITGAVFASLVLLIIFIRKVPKKLKVESYTESWVRLQVNCKDKNTWNVALLDADKLLNKALKRRRFKGKRMGERMVSAQRKFSDNDAVWFAHNLCKKVLTDPDARLREKDVKNALVGFRQALRDLGALPGGKEMRNEK